MVKVFNISGNWIIGEVSGDKQRIKNPRLYFFDTKQHAVLLMPGNPNEIPYSKDYFQYALPPGEVFTLYVKHTTNIEVVSAVPANLVSANGKATQ